MFADVAAACRATSFAAARATLLCCLARDAAASAARRRVCRERVLLRCRDMPVQQRMLRAVCASYCPYAARAGAHMTAPMPLRDAAALPMALMRGARFIDGPPDWRAHDLLLAADVDARFTPPLRVHAYDDTTPRTVARRLVADSFHSPFYYAIRRYFQFTAFPAAAAPQPLSPAAPPKMFTAAAICRRRTPPETADRRRCRFAPPRPPPPIRATITRARRRLYAITPRYLQR